jgi:hypothetical protein
MSTKSVIEPCFSWLYSRRWALACLASPYKMQTSDLLGTRWNYSRLASASLKYTEPPSSSTVGQLHEQLSNSPKYGKETAASTCKPDVAGTVLMFLWHAPNPTKPPKFSDLPNITKIRPEWPLKISDLPNLPNVMTSLTSEFSDLLTSQICQPSWPLKIFDLFNSPKAPTSLTSQTSWPS